MGKLSADEYEVLLDGLVTGDPSGAIERQEARGQQQLVHSDMLPLECLTRGGWEILEAQGLKRGEAVDNLFVKVTLPPGWTKVATDHAMWSDLRDEHGRTRAGIFYKSAFYDRQAHFRLDTRYKIASHHETEGSESWNYVVWDGPTVLFRPGVGDAGDDYDRHRRQERACDDWLNERYPDWRNPAAYWDE